jgi:hypothetical protein
MNYRLALLFVLVVASTSVQAFAQPVSSRNDTTRSSRGRDFYMAFLPNFHEESRDSSNTRDSLFIFITCDKATSGRITYRTRLGREVSRAFALPDPTQIFTFAMNYGDIELEGFNANQILNRFAQSEQVAPQYVRIEANDDVTVYALNQARFTSDAHLVLPVPALGREYVVMAYTSDGSGLPFFGNMIGSDTPSQFAVVAVADNTEITVSRTVATFPSQSSSTHTVRLQRGESYLLQADTRINTGRGDLTGSRVKATKPVAVFGGHQRTVLPIQLKAALSSRDHLVEQMPPVETWGKSIFLVPHAQPSNQAIAGSDVYRIVAAYNGTQVLLNGQPLATLNAGEFYEAPLTQEGWVTANEQILVAQFKKTATPTGLSGGLGPQVGDPFMMVIPTVEQYDKSYRFINAQVPDDRATGGQSFIEHYVTIVVHANGVRSLLFDGQPVPQNRFLPILNSGYVYGNFRVSGGVHTARGDSAFGIYVYGYGQANSYGYIGGGKLRVIAPDRDPPQIVLRRECFGVSGTVLDTLVTDSRIDSVRLAPTTLANVTLNVEPFMRYADSVRFRADLVNIFADGGFTVEARDSVGFVSRRTVPIFGFTVGLQGQNATGAAVPVRLQIPTGRTRTFPFVIRNYGATAQTISTLRFMLGTPNLQIVGTTLPIVLAAGASETLQVSYRALSDGIVNDTLRVGNTCATRAVALFTLEAITDRTPPLIAKTPDACSQRIAFDVTDGGTLASGVASVTPIRLVNCTLRTDSIGAVRTRSILSVTNPRLDAFYTIQVQDSSGNIATVSDVIQGFTVALVGDRTTLGNFGATSTGGTTNCIRLEYRNTGSLPFSLRNLAPQGNMSFSAPPLQFPITIAPGATSRITLCFVPTEFRDYRDTLILGANCVGDTLILRGTGITPVYDATSRCDVPIQLRVLSTPAVLAIVHTAPQPVSDVATVRVQSSEAATISTTLYSTDGIERGGPFVMNVEAGETDVRLDTKNLETGVYFCVVQSGLKRVMRQLVIIR